QFQSYRGARVNLYLSNPHLLHLLQWTSLPVVASILTIPKYSNSCLAAQESVSMSSIVMAQRCAAFDNIGSGLIRLLITASAVLLSTLDDSLTGLPLQLFLFSI